MHPLTHHNHSHETEPLRYNEENPHDPDAYRPLCICRILKPGEDPEALLYRDLLILKGEEDENGLLQKSVYNRSHGGPRHRFLHFALFYHSPGSSLYFVVFPLWLAQLDVCEFICDELTADAFYCAWRLEAFKDLRPRVFDAWKVEEIRAPLEARGNTKISLKVFMAMTEQLSFDALDRLLDVNTRVPNSPNDLFIEKRNIPLWKKRGMFDADDEEEEIAPEDVDKMRDALPGPLNGDYFEASSFVNEFWERRHAPLDALRNWVSHYLFRISDHIYGVTLGGGFTYYSASSFRSLPLTVDRRNRNNKKMRVNLSKEVEMALPIYDGFTFHSQQPSIYQNKVNLWRGWRLNADDLALFPYQSAFDNPNFIVFMMALCERLFNSNMLHMYYALSFIRHAYVTPYECPARMLVLCGVHGIGKGAFFDQFLGKRVFGKHYTSVKSPEELLSQFNGFMVENAVLHLDDVKLNTAHYHRLKSMITETQGSLELKGANRVKVDHLVHHIVHSANSIDFAVDMTERRFLMFNTGDKLYNHIRIYDEQRWGELNRTWYNVCSEDNDIALSFIHFLVNELDPTLYNNLPAPPQTDLLKTAMLASLPFFERRYVQSLVDGHTVQEKNVTFEPELYTWDDHWCTSLPYDPFHVYLFGNSKKTDISWFVSYGISIDFKNARKFISLPKLKDARIYALHKWPTLDFHPVDSDPAVLVWTHDSLKGEPRFKFQFEDTDGFTRRLKKYTRQAIPSVETLNIDE